VTCRTRNVVAREQRELLAHAEAVGSAQPAAVALAKEKRQSEKSKTIELFAWHLRSNLIQAPEREYVFHPTRKWRFDFAWPALLVAVEIEGLVVRKLGGQLVLGGRHATIGGFQEDCIKYAEAACLGWHVLRFNQALVRKLDALDFTIRALHRARLHHQ
jgi:hypothetical protein